MFWNLIVTDFYATNLTSVNGKLEAVIITFGVEVQFDHIILRYEQTTSHNFTTVKTCRKNVMMQIVIYSLYQKKKKLQ